MRAAAGALPAFEVAVRRGRAALARLEDVRVHAEAHRAAGTPPLEPGLDEDPVQPFGFRLRLHLSRSGDDHRADAGMHVLAAHHGRRRAEILDARIRARADEDAVDCDLAD